MNTPSPDNLRFAAEWLRAYDDTHDGGAGTADAARVAEWLDSLAQAKEVRDLARTHGVPIAALRKRLGVI